MDIHNFCNQYVADAKQAEDQADQTVQNFWPMLETNDASLIVGKMTELCYLRAKRHHAVTKEYADQALEVFKASESTSWDVLAKLKESRLAAQNAQNEATKATNVAKSLNDVLILLTKI